MNRSDTNLSVSTTLSSISLLRKVVAEFIGTLLFLFVVVTSTTIPGRYLDANPALSLLIAAFMQGLSLVAIVSAFDGVSGSHFNPAITGMLTLIRSLPLIQSALYVTAQLAGGIAGSALAKASLGQTINAATKPTIAVGRAFLVEVLITSILLLVVISSATDLESAMAPVPIGFAVLVGVLLGGSVSGGSMNPARSFGPAVIENEWESHWIYWIAPLAASFLVAILHHIVFRKRRGKTQPHPGVTELV